MNILLIVGLVLFACVIAWVYILFITNTINESGKAQPKEIVYDDVLEHCRQLYNQGLHTELQRYAQKELSKNFSDIELRRILAQSLMETNNEKTALMHFEAILNIAPYDIETQELLAKYYSDKGPIQRAIELYEQILMHDSGNVEAVETLAKLYEQDQNYNKAIEMYRMILDAEVDENRIIELKYTLADLYLKTQNYKEAYDAYKNIHKEDGENLEILILMADLAYKNHYWQDCLKHYKEIIAIVGDDFEMLEKIAQLQTTLENWLEASETYKKIISLEDTTSSNYLYHQNQLCNAMINNKQYKEVIDLLKDLLAQYPKETSFAITLAQAYTKTGDFQAAIDIYNRLLEEMSLGQDELIINCISTTICAWAGDLFKKGEYNLAFDKFFEALKYNEENDEVYYELGRCNYYIKSFQDSIAHFKRAILIKPDESKYYFALGCAYNEAGSIKDAKIAFYDALNIDPMNTQARIAYAIILTNELEYAQSIEQFIEVLKYIPNNADTLYNLALAYELVGDKERAIKFYKKALDIDNNHKEARHNIELLLGEPYVIGNKEHDYIDDNEPASMSSDNSDLAQEENLDFNTTEGSGGSIFG